MADSELGSFRSARIGSGASTPASSSSRRNLPMSRAAGAQRVAMSGQGFFNYATQEGELTLDMNGLPTEAAASLPSGSLHMEEIFKASSEYVGSSLFAGKLPGGARWVKIDLGRVTQALGLNMQQLAGQSNPAQFLQYLRATAGTVTPVGSELVRGVPTTHYRATVDLDRVADVVPSADRGPLH